MRPAASPLGMSSYISDPLLEKSSLYREFLAELREIERHKWFKSEQAGHDIGFETALVDWSLNHRAEWRRSRQAAKSQPAEVA